MAISEEMVAPIPQAEEDIWKQIDLSESYMVCCMFEEAASLASSVVKVLHSSTSMKAIGDAELGEMLESAGMVFVQSLKELGRTNELFDELKVLFSSVAAVPVQVFLTGACMQISEGRSSNLRTVFEDFLEKWVYIKDEANVFQKVESSSSSFEGCIWQASIPVDKYLEVVDVYCITVLGTVLHEPDVAVSWTEKAGLPEEKRQDILRQLQSLYAATYSRSFEGPSTTSKEDLDGGISVREDGLVQNHPIGDKLKPTSLNLIKPSVDRFSDRTVRLKFGNFRLVLPRGKVLFLGSLMVFIFYILRKRREALKRYVARQASSIRRALIDAWQLAFSVQVNPLAAVQQLPAAGSQRSR